MLNFAVIGAGYWGTKLIKEYLTLSKKRPEIRLRAIADVSADRLLHIRDEFPLSNLTLETDYNRLLNDPEISGIHIATSNETHFEIASRAIALGKHVLLEKPMSLTASDAFKLARFAEKKSAVLLVGHIFRFNNCINKVKELFERKEMGETVCVELRWTSLMPPPPGRDIVFDLAPHPIDILNHVFEEWPTRVYVKALSFERKEIGLEEVAFATFGFPNNMMVSVSMSWLHHGPRERTVIISNRGNAIKIDAVEQTMSMFEKGQERKITVERNNTIEAEITHFVERIKKNDPPINSALTGAMNVTVLQAMRQSLTDDKVVTIIGG